MFLGSEGPTFFQIRALFFGLGQKPKKFSEKFQSTKKNIDIDSFFAEEPVGEQRSARSFVAMYSLAWLEESPDWRIPWRSRN